MRNTINSIQSAKKSLDFKVSFRASFMALCLVALQIPNSWAAHHQTIYVSSTESRFHETFSTAGPIGLVLTTIFAPYAFLIFTTALPFVATTDSSIHDNEFREVINAVGADAADFLASDGERESSLLTSLKKSLRSLALEHNVTAILELDDQEIAQRIIAAVDQI